MYRIYCFSLLIILANVKAQENLTYQKPSDEILNLVDVTLPPRVVMDESKKYMVCIYRDAYKTIKELSEQEMRLGGLRINPKTNIGSRTTCSIRVPTPYPATAYSPDCPTYVKIIAAAKA